MKKQITILVSLLLITISVLSQDCPKGTKFVDKKYYTVCYSEKHKNPVKVTYKLYKPKSFVERGSMDFYHENGVLTATNADYVDNVYDKGHLAPAEAFSTTKEMLYSTFSYVNCAVQHYKLNRGVWKALENYERQLAQHDSIMVINIVTFNKKYPQQLKTGTYIPDTFEKIIINLRTNVKRRFVFPNVEPAYKDYKQYEVFEPTKRK